MTREKGDGTAGDAADAEASAVFIGNVLSFLLREHAEGLTLFPNLPPVWCRPAGKITLNTSTLFGQVRCRLEFSNDGRKGSLRLSSLDGRGTCGAPVVCLEGLRRQGFRFSDGSPLPELYRWQWHRDLELDFVRDLDRE